MLEHSEFTIDGIHFVSLACITDGGSREIWVAPDYGMNLCRFTVDGRNVIDFEAEAVKHDFSGTPLLYPTPNRVFHGVFRYNGREYPQVKRGNTILSHGLLYDEPFDGVEVQEGTDSITISAHKDFLPGDGVYEAFPFRHRLSVKYTLSFSGVRFEYEIANHDVQALPYGIALHPYFMKLDGEDGTLVNAPFEWIYENIEEDLIPTGKLISARGTASDLMSYRPVGELDLDTVYTGNEGNRPASVRYNKLGLEVMLKCSPEFSHMVIYTPPGEPFFCMENQTCSTDAHNLFDKAFRQESGLKFVPPGGRANGYIKYKIKYLK